MYVQCKALLALHCIGQNIITLISLTCLLSGVCGLWTRLWRHFRTLKSFCLLMLRSIGLGNSQEISFHWSRNSEVAFPSGKLGILRAPRFPTKWRLPYNWAVHVVYVKYAYCSKLLFSERLSLFAVSAKCRNMYSIYSEIIQQHNNIATIIPAGTETFIKRLKNVTSKRLSLVENVRLKNVFRRLVNVTHKPYCLLLLLLRVAVRPMCRIGYSEIQVGKHEFPG